MSFSHRDELKSVKNTADKTTKNQDSEMFCVISFRLLWLARLLSCFLISECKASDVRNATSSSFLHDRVSIANQRQQFLKQTRHVGTHISCMIKVYLTRLQCFKSRPPTAPKGMFWTPLTVLTSVRQCVRDYMFLPVSIDGFSPNLCQ